MAMRFNYLTLLLIGNFIIMAVHAVVAADVKGLEPYQRIIRDAAVEYSGYADAVLPNAESKCLYSDVTLNNKEEVINDSISWVKSVVKEEWLIENIRRQASFFKKDKNNITNACEYSGIIFEYEISGNWFVIQDSSNRISVLINMPSSTNVVFGGEKFIKNSLNKYIKTSKEMIENGEYKLQAMNELYYGSVQKPKDISLAKISSEGVNWENMHVLTDGKSMIFISFEGLSRKISGRSGVRTQMKQAPIKKRFYPSELPPSANK